MNHSDRSRALAMNDNRFMRYLFLLSIFLMSLTGFGQMPIYKRYYLSDIPGFGWLANFWTTRYVHYAGAALLLAVREIARRRYAESGAQAALVAVVSVLLAIVLQAVLVPLLSGFFFTARIVSSAAR